MACTAPLTAIYVCMQWLLPFPPCHLISRDLPCTREAAENALVDKVLPAHVFELLRYQESVLLACIVVTLTGFL